MYTIYVCYGQANFKRAYLTLYVWADPTSVSPCCSKKCKTSSSRRDSYFGTDRKSHTHQINSMLSGRRSLWALSELSQVPQQCIGLDDWRCKCRSGSVQSIPRIFITRGSLFSSRSSSQWRSTYEITHFFCYKFLEDIAFFASRQINPLMKGLFLICLLICIGSGHQIHVL